MRIANTPWIGHHRGNPAFVDDKNYLRALDLARELRATHIRFDLCFDSLCSSPDVIEPARLIWVVDQAAKRSLGVMPIIGRGPYPNQPAWHGLAQRKAWDPAIPPLPAQGRVIAMTNILFQHVVETMVRGGRDPKYFVKPQVLGEVCIGGANGPAGSVAEEGTWAPQVLEYAGEFVRRFASFGCDLVSPSFECQLTPFPRELTTAFPTKQPFWPAFRYVALSCYEWNRAVGPLSRFKDCRERILSSGTKARSFLSTPEFVAVEMGQKGATVEEARKWLDVMQEQGISAGWYTTLQAQKSPWDLAVV